MTHLRQALLEELHRRDYAAPTIRAYVRIIEDVTRYFRRPPDQLSPPQLRQYQAHRFTERKLQPGTVQQHVARPVARWPEVCLSATIRVTRRVRRLWIPQESTPITRDATGAHLWAYDITRGTLGKRTFEVADDASSHLDA